MGFLSLAAGEVVENVSLDGIIRIIDSYDEAADTATFTMFNTYFYDIPIVVEGATNVKASASSASYPFATGRQTTVTGTVECINGVIHFKAGATLSATKNPTISYVYGNEYAMINIPKVVNAGDRIRVPSTFSTTRAQELASQYKGYYWSANNDAVTFETVEENGETVTYMVIGSVDKETVVSVTAAIKRFLGTTELGGYTNSYEFTIKP
jgi:PKD repeat protein